MADIQPLTALRVDEIRQHLEPGTAMLAYSVGSEGVHLFVLTREKPLVVVPLPVTEAELWVQTARFFQLVLTIDEPRSPGLEDTVEVADAETRLTKGRWLFDHLVAPAAEHLQDAERLVILPDSVLYYLPFAALVRPTDAAGGWQYLVEWKPLHTAQSATVYAELRKRRPGSDDRKTPRTLVALGDPSYPRTSAAAGEAVRSAQERGIFEGLDPLPNTRREVEAIAGIFEDGARVFLGDAATEENAKAELPAARYVHFATHGLADPQQPRHSFLALSIPEGLPPERENGILQAWEIVDQLRLDADLVVLSACVTALGPVHAGEGLMSLSRAFQVAGARTVAATLWPVADESTAELMIRFYGHLLKDVPKDEALRAAQLEFIRGPVPVPDGKGGTEEKDFSSPYYWAPFQLIGDWR
ncbi:MAG: CHAT domain-containing protein [bacterium]|nr:CHAT domain-containing protein [bacterium]